MKFENSGSAYGNLIHHLPCNHWLLRHDLGRLAACLRRSQGGRGRGRGRARVSPGGFWFAQDMVRGLLKVNPLERLKLEDMGGMGMG